MKKVIISILLGSTLVVGAQTNNTGVTGFVTQVTQWIASFNTNYDVAIAACKMRLWTGVDSVQGGNESLVNEIGVSYDALTKNKVLSLEAVERNGGVAGTLISVQGGASLNFLVHDFMLSLYCDGGKYMDNIVSDKGKKNEMFGEIGIRGFKALGPNTYTGVGLGTQFPTSRQLYMAYVGIRL